MKSRRTDFLTPETDMYLSELACWIRRLEEETARMRVVYDREQQKPPLWRSRAWKDHRTLVDRGAGGT